MYSVTGQVTPLDVTGPEVWASALRPMWGADACGEGNFYWRLGVERKTTSASSTFYVHVPRLRDIVTGTPGGGGRARRGAELPPVKR